MKIVLAVLPLLVVAWLGTWAFNTGILVFSADSAIPKTRECYYLIGVSVQKRMELGGCPFVRRLGT